MRKKTTGKKAGKTNKKPVAKKKVVPVLKKAQVTIKKPAAKKKPVKIVTTQEDKAKAIFKTELPADLLIEVQEEENGKIEFIPRPVQSRAGIVGIKDKKMPFYYYTKSVRYFRLMSSLHNLVNNIKRLFSYYVTLSDIEIEPKLVKTTLDSVKVGEQFRCGPWYVKTEVVEEAGRVYNARVVDGKFVTYIQPGRTVYQKP